MVTEPQTIELSWKYNQGLRKGQLGREKYAKLSTALAELVSNSLDADARTVNIRIQPNQMSGVESVEISDDGNGISRTVLEDRFLDVGNKPSPSKMRFGRFGIGRFAVYRIGSRSDWETVSKNDRGELTKLHFSLDESDTETIPVRSEAISKGASGTKITIYNTSPEESGYLTSSKFCDDLLSTFFSYLLSHPTKRILIDGKQLDPNSLKESDSTEEVTVEVPDKGTLKATITHIHLRKSVSNDRFQSQLLFCSKGKCIAGEEMSVIAPNNYLALVNSDYFEELVTTNRESLVQMDSGYKHLLHAVLESIAKYQKVRGEQNAKSFLERARNETYYPYHNPSSDPTAQVERAIYDVMLEKLHEKTNLDKLPVKLRCVLFKLLNRAMKNSNLLDVLGEVAELTDDDIERFKKVLKKTTLEQIIKLSDEVTRRLEFLKSLHEMTYGNISSHLKERTQLHKVLENHTWLFGDKYHLSTSDKSFRTIIQRHRSELDLVDVPDEELQKIGDYKKIPDLFLVKKRDYPIDPKHQQLIVEIKAPSVKIGSDEIAQIKKYANIILKSSHFSKESVHWDLFLVSAEVSSEVDLDRSQQNRERGLIHDVKGMKVWVFQWSEIIQRAEEEMSLVRNHLQLKSEELQISAELKEAYPFLNAAGSQ